MAVDVNGTGEGEEEAVGGAGDGGGVSVGCSADRAVGARVGVGCSTSDGWGALDIGVAGVQPVTSTSMQNQVTRRMIVCINCPPLLARRPLVCGRRALSSFYGPTARASAAAEARSTR